MEIIGKCEKCKKNLVKLSNGNVVCRCTDKALDERLRIEAESSNGHNGNIKYSTTMKTEIKKILYRFLQDETTSDDAAQQVLDLFDVSGSLPIKRYDIDFGDNVMAGIEIKGESLSVFGVINGYGDGIDDEKIKITERRQ